MNDQDIVALYWSRSERAIAESEQKYGQYCYTVAYNILHSREDAEECVNDTWLRAWESIPPQRPERLSTYLGKLCRNLSLNRYKQLHTEKRGMGQVTAALEELEQCVPSPSADVGQQVADELALTAAIERFLTAQPPRRRNIFIRRYFAMTPIREIAAHYGMRESRVTSLLFRMREQLKQELEKEGILL